jgi:hypothetical protein
MPIISLLNLQLLFENIWIFKKNKHSYVHKSSMLCIGKQMTLNLDKNYFLIYFEFQHNPTHILPSLVNSRLRCKETEKFFP